MSRMRKHDAPPGSLSAICVAGTQWSRATRSHKNPGGPAGNRTTRKEMKWVLLGCGEGGDGSGIALWKTAQAPGPTIGLAGHGQDSLIPPRMKQESVGRVIATR